MLNGLLLCIHQHVFLLANIFTFLAIFSVEISFAAGSPAPTDGRLPKFFSREAWVDSRNCQNRSPAETGQQAQRLEVRRRVSLADWYTSSQYDEAEAAKQ